MPTTARQAQRAPAIQPSKRLAAKASVSHERANGNPRATAQGFDFTRTPASTIQRKPALSAPGDAFEREADVVADKVMRMADTGRVAPAAPAIQRTCSQCNDDDMPIRTKRASESAPPSLDTTYAAQAATLGGAPLPREARAFFEPRFGRDFSQVRVHSDTAAANAARSVQARAYTLGSHIVFGAGEYAPASAPGRRLLAHELTHVVQQSTGSAGRPDSLLQREPTRPRAVTGKESIADLTAQTAGTQSGKVTAGSLARQEWESLFKRHFVEPDKVEDEVESSHARYLYSNVYGWIDAQHFFAHIQFAEEMGLQGATNKGIEIEQNQALVRKVIGPDPDDPTIYSDFLEHNLISPADFLHYREDLFMAISAGMGAVLNKQEKALIQGFDDEKLAKVILDNAMSAWSYEDLVSNQLGVQFFRLHGADVNAGKDAADVRKRFIDSMTAYFAFIDVVDDAAAVKKLAKKLPGKERWTSPKMTLPEAKKKFPELFEFANASHRIRVVIHDKQAGAEQGRTHIVAVAPSVPGLHVEALGSQFAVYTGAMSRFEAVVRAALLSKTIPINRKSLIIEAVAAPTAAKP